MNERKSSLIQSVDQIILTCILRFAWLCFLHHSPKALSHLLIINLPIALGEMET